MKSRIVSIIQGSLLVSQLFACGPEVSLPRELGESSDTRVHRRFPLQSNISLSLANHRPEIIKLSHLGESPWAAWILYDSQAMPLLVDVEAGALLRGWLDSYGDFIGSHTSEEWQSLGSQDISKLYRAYRFQRQIDGIPVRDSLLQIMTSRDESGSWRVVEVMANVSGPLSPQGREEILDDQSLLQIEGNEQLLISSKKLEWIPFPRGTQFDHELATSYEVIDAHGDDRVITLLHKDWQVFENYSLSLHMKPIQARALKRSYLDAGPREYPLAFATSVQGAQSTALGAEALMGGGALAVSLQGSRAVITDKDGKVPTLSGLIDQGDKVLLNSQSYDFAAVNAFVAVQRINRFVRQFIDPDQLKFLDESVRVIVNSDEGSCNAFYSPKAQRILLYKEDSECANMALLNDVIFHEWGHALDDHTGATPGIVDYAFSEGVADTLASFYNEDPDIAPGFFFNDANGVRSVANTRTFPRDLGSTHFEGGIISGAFWDLRQELIAQEGKRRGAYLAAQLFMGHLLSADSYMESYAAVLRLDDDDGRPETPSPHACLIQKAFAKHGLAMAPEKACVPSARLLSKADATLQLTLWEESPASPQVRLLLASPDAKRLVYCWSKREDCERTSVVRQELTVLDEGAGQRFFASDILRLPARLNTLSVLSLDDAGQVLGGRQFVIHDK